MKLLICTQVVDSQDSNLGFFHRWIEEFAKQCEKVTVVCLKEGAYVFPENVVVLSLGKEQGTSKLTRIFRFYTYIFAHKNNYDIVLVHMNPEYIVLGGYFWRRWNKKIGLWYAHKSVTRKLRFAMHYLTQVFTVSNDSFQIRSPKVLAMGHGIDTELFKPTQHLESTTIRIYTVGRIARSKHLIEMLETLDALTAKEERFSLTIIGAPTTPEEEEYAKELVRAIETRPYREKVRMVGSVPHHELPALFHSHDVCFNFGGTGNMDKAGLEALACGIPLLTTNSSFEPLLKLYGLYVPTMEGVSVSDALLRFLSRPNQPRTLATLRNKVVEEHSLVNLIPKILKKLA